MEIRPVLEKWFGKRTIYKIFDDPLELKVDNPLPSDGRPFYAYVGLVEGKNWRPDQLSFIEFRNGEFLDNLLTNASEFYEKLFGRKLKIVINGSYLDTDAHILLGTRSKAIKEYLRNYRAATN